MAPAHIEYLQRFGLNPASIVAVGFDESGYERITSSEEGQERSFREWPEGFDFEHFKALVPGWIVELDIPQAPEYTEDIEATEGEK